MLELVEPAGEDSPVLGFLKRGGGLHHLCYEVSHLEQQLELSQSMGGRIVRPPLPASVFEGRRIAWVFTKDRLLLELLESAPHTDGLDGHARLKTDIRKDEWLESGDDRV
jgi:methylmalonyl-CoA/ethylmalonyl-CoA epimerase